MVRELAPQDQTGSYSRPKAAFDEWIPSPKFPVSCAFDSFQVQAEGLAFRCTSGIVTIACCKLPSRGCFHFASLIKHSPSKAGLLLELTTEVPSVVSIIFDYW
jgi:hypothetical protein